MDRRWQDRWSIGAGLNPDMGSGVLPAVEPEPDEGITKDAG